MSDDDTWGGITAEERARLLNGTWECTSLVLHPDVCERDPYGVLTLCKLYQYMEWARGYQEAWNDLRQTLVEMSPGMRLLAPPPLGYADLRDAVRGAYDVPYTMACAIALWLTRDSRDMFWLGFTPVL